MLNADVELVGRKGKGKKPLSLPCENSKCNAHREAKEERVYKVHLLLLSESQTLSRIILGLLS